MQPGLRKVGDAAKDGRRRVSDHGRVHSDPRSAGRPRRGPCRRLGRLRDGTLAIILVAPREEATTFDKLLSGLRAARDRAMGEAGQAFFETVERMWIGPRSANRKVMAGLIVNEDTGTKIRACEAWFGP